MVDFPVNCTSILHLGRNTTIALHYCHCIPIGITRTCMNIVFLVQMAVFSLEASKLPKMCMHI